MKAILVDAYKREVRPVELKDDCEIVKIIGCDYLTMAFRLKGSFSYCDDNGLINGTSVGIKFKCYPDPIMGNVLFLGADGMGESQSTDLCVEEVEREIEGFIGIENKGHRLDCECAKCAGMSGEDFYKTVMDNIKNHGIHVTGVLSGFTYTTGMNLIDFPDVITFGIPMGVAGHIFNKLYDDLKSGRVIEFGKKYNDYVDGDYSVVFIEVDSKVAEEYMFLSKDFANDEFKACQMVIPDVNNKFPWEKGYSLKNQPLIGDYKGK